MCPLLQAAPKTLQIKGKGQVQLQSNHAEASPYQKTAKCPSLWWNVMKYIYSSTVLEYKFEVPVATSYSTESQRQILFCFFTPLLSNSLGHWFLFIPSFPVKNKQTCKFKITDFKKILLIIKMNKRFKTLSDFAGKVDF